MLVEAAATTQISIPCHHGYSAAQRRHVCLGKAAVVNHAVTPVLYLAQAEVLALQTHHQTVQAAKAAASKPAGAAGAGGKGAATAAPAPPAALKQAVAPAGKRKPGEPAVVSAGKGMHRAAVHVF